MNSTNLTSGTTQCNTENVTNNIKKKRNRSDLGPDFVAPDGGWAWVVCIAAGFSNLFIFPLMQQFGFLFLDRLKELGLTTSEITTIINTNAALASCVGLLNGPLFRRFSTRQVAFLGTSLVVSGILLTSFANSFPIYLITHSIIYGIGIGISMSTSMVILNVYFHKKRRIATSISWTITGVGYTTMPHVANYVLEQFGVKPAVWFFAGIASLSGVCAMAYQPVINHAKQCQPETGLNKNEDDNKNDIGSAEVCDEYILVNGKLIPDFVSSEEPLPENPDQLHSSSSDEHSLRHRTGSELPKTNVFTVEDRIPQQNSEPNVDVATNVQEKSRIAIWFGKIAQFFDLDLLKDLTLVNLIIGITVSNFAENNFTVLIPFIFNEYGYSPKQIALMTSVLGLTDLVSRISIPLVTSKIKFQNKTFFLIGSVGMAIGRIFIIHAQSSKILLVIAVWIGLFRGLRTIFSYLVIPSHVHINRLPAAMGLNMVGAGIFFLLFGPVVGLIQDNTNFNVTLQFFNFLTLLMIVSWIGEDLYHLRKKRTQNN